MLQVGSSLRPPRSAVPKLLSCADCEETNTAVAAICEWMNRRYWLYESRAIVLFERLELIIEAKLRATASPASVMVVPVPPGWLIFLRKWLHRAVRFLVHRGCEEGGPGHQLGHWHDDDGHAYYAAQSDTVLSEEDRKQLCAIEEMKRSHGNLGLGSVQAVSYTHLTLPTKRIV